MNCKKQHKAINSKICHIEFNLNKDLAATVALKMGVIAQSQRSHGLTIQEVTTKNSIDYV